MNVFHTLVKKFRDQLLFKYDNYIVKYINRGVYNNFIIIHKINYYYMSKTLLTYYALII